MDPPAPNSTTSAEPELVVPVVFVCPYARLGGAERYLLLLLERLGASWIRDVVVLQDGPFVDRLREAGYRVTVIPTSARAPGILRSAWALRRLLRSREPSVVHANGIKAAIVTVLATLASPIPVVWVKHDFSYDGPLARLVARRCRRVIGVSEAVTRTFGRAADGKVAVIHNAIPPIQVDRARARGSLAAVLPSPATTVVGLVGRLEPGKGHLELLAVAPQLLERIPDLHIILVGADHPAVAEYAAKLRARAEGDDLSSRVTLVGHRDDAVELIAGCDALVIPSIPTGDREIGRESFSYVGLEAMAVGTPVVGYADGGLPEILGPCAELVPPGDREALRDAILRVVEDLALRERLARCGRARAATDFSLERMVDSTKQRYREAAREAA
jgi:glycosyltransferase involved in cell wall biosynthesis